METTMNMMPTKRLPGMNAAGLLLTATAMTGGFVDQLTDPRNPGVFVGSVLHVVGLAAAVAGGVGTVLSVRTVAARGR